MRNPNADVSADQSSVDITPNRSNTTILGASMPYESLKDLEQLMLSDPKLTKLRGEGFRPNKTDLVKMSLILFFNSPISTERLIAYWKLASNDEWRKK